MSNTIDEKTIEDILSSDSSIAAEILGVQAAELSLIARQKPLPSGRLDLLYLYKSEMLLVELKVVAFSPEMIAQVDAYASELRELQEQRKLVGGDLRKVLVVTGSSPEDRVRCQKATVVLLVYDPQYILSIYYQKVRSLSVFLTIQSSDYGVVRLGLLRPALRAVAQGVLRAQMGPTLSRSSKTVRNRLSVAHMLGLVVKTHGEYFLTDLGDSFIDADGADANEDRLNDAQVNLLCEFVNGNPFYSSITYTVLCLVEAVFVLARGSYPVQVEALREYFVASVGKSLTWKTAKARQTATYIYSNYACELLLLAKVKDSCYLTPRGVRAVLLLQLNRSIKLINAQG